MFILADDLGIDGLGCYGADHFKTPNIDKLAREGTRFNHFYTAPLCGPSRAVIMTGRYAFHTGATSQDATGQMKPTVETFMPTYLKQAGYVSACIGKWGQLPLGPAEFGFDQNLIFKGSGIYWNTQDKGKTYTVNGEFVTLNENEYLPDIMHNFLVDFITKHREDPFYVYYSLSHVHSEILPTPDSAPNSKDLYADNIAYMDKLVGMLIAELDRLKLRENTLVVFLGDNGTATGPAQESTIGGRHISGTKGTMLEGGALVPFILNWPGKTPQGRVSNRMIDSSDFVPTFTEFVGAKLPDPTRIDGQSFLPVIYGKPYPKPSAPRETIFIELGAHWYVREENWKLDQDGHLFDMSRAPFEEPVVPDDTSDPAAIAARTRLHAALSKLNPAGGILDTGDPDGSGRHANWKENRSTKKPAKKSEQDDD